MVDTSTSEGSLNAFLLTLTIKDGVVESSSNYLTCPVLQVGQGHALVVHVHQPLHTDPVDISCQG